MDDSHPGTDTPVVIDRHRETWRQSIFHYLPAFLYLLVVFVLLKVFSVDLRRPLGYEEFALSIMDILTIVAAGITALEMLKVSHPGVNNVAEVIAMSFMAVVFVIFFLLAEVGTRVLWIFPPRIFANSEFLMLTLFASVEAVVAQIVNARTLARSVTDYR